MNNLTSIRKSTIKRTEGCEIGDIFAAATIAAAANGRGSPNDRRRNRNRARIVASYIEAAEQLGGNQTIEGQEHLIRAGRVAREGESL